MFVFIYIKISYSFLHIWVCKTPIVKILLTTILEHPDEFDFGVPFFIKPIITYSISIFRDSLLECGPNERTRTYYEYVMGKPKCVPIEKTCPEHTR